MVSTNIKPRERLFPQGLLSILRGAGQVMFQDSGWTGFFFLAGIFWGSYVCGVPQVAWGALVALVVSTIGGWLMYKDPTDAVNGLWGFNGILVGCAFPTFLGNTWLMWVSLVFFAYLSVWMRRGLNNMMTGWGINSLTFPFVMLTWFFLFCARICAGIDPVGMSHPSAIDGAGVFALDMSFGSLVIYWLKGVAQVFLVNNWVTGILFLVGLAACSRWAALWAAVASAISLAMAILFQANPADISEGLFGFSPVLTGIALGMTFFSPKSWKTAGWAVLGIISTFFIQAAMDVMLQPWGLPTLTGPFCLTTWLFLLPFKAQPKKS